MRNIIRETKKAEIKKFMENITALYEDDTYLLSELDNFMSLLEDYENVEFHTLREAMNPLSIPMRMEEADELHLLIWELYNSPK
jgi:hypothetical protein|nr:MAG TPA: hypothetical protein [Caudoviricetes sp.]